MQALERIPDTVEAALPAGRVVAVHLSPKHTFSKQTRASIHLLAGLGVKGDAHCGALVRHRYLVKRDPTQPNLTQVHLLEEERLAELNQQGFDLNPGDLGENITTSGLDLLRLPLGTRLHFGEAVVELTGLRTPCSQMNGLQPGLMSACVERGPAGILRKAGVMAIVLAGGEVKATDSITVTLPDGEPIPLGPV